MNNIEHNQDVTKDAEGQSSAKGATLNDGLGLPKFCTINDLNFTSEIMHGELKHSDVYGDYYMFEDGDCYKPELVRHYGAIFTDNDPRTPNVK